MTSQPDSSRKQNLGWELKCWYFYWEVASPRWFRGDGREWRGKQQSNETQCHLPTTDRLTTICRDTQSQAARLCTWYMGLFCNWLQVTTPEQSKEGRKEEALFSQFPTISSALSIEVPQGPPSAPQDPLRRPDPMAWLSKHRRKGRISCRWGSAFGVWSQRDSGPNLRLQEVKEPAKVAESGGRQVLQKKEVIPGLGEKYKDYVQYKCLAMTWKYLAILLHQIPWTALITKRSHL